MTTRPTSVTCELQLRLLVQGASSLPVRAALNYDVDDPYAVQVGFHTGSPGGSDVVEWTFARQLLGEGVHTASGEGDVQVWPSASGGVAVVCLSLSAPSGRALFEVPLAELVEFLARTYEAVPTGTESAHLDVEVAFARLLGVEPEA